MMKFCNRKFKYLDCNYEFEIPEGIPKRSIKCKKCNFLNIIKRNKEENVKDNIFGSFINKWKDYMDKSNKRYRCGWKKGRRKNFNSNCERD